MSKLDLIIRLFVFFVAIPLLIWGIIYAQIENRNRLETLRTLRSETDSLSKVVDSLQSKVVDQIIQLENLELEGE